MINTYILFIYTHERGCTPITRIMFVHIRINIYYCTDKHHNQFSRQIINVFLYYYYCFVTSM